MKEKQKRPSKKSNNKYSKIKGLKELLAAGKVKGHLTYEEVNNILPEDVVSSEAIDEILTILGEEKIKIIRDTARKLGTTVAILQDLAGPKIRIGSFETETVHLKADAVIVLTMAARYDTHETTIFDDFNYRLTIEFIIMT